MLTLRKEMKVGFGIGAAVLGVAAVYGAMAMLTSRGDAGGPADGAPVTQIDSGGGDVIVGLPEPEPVDAAVNPLATPPAVTENKTGSKPTDPFAESARNDGNTSDPWTTALVTGRVPSANQREVQSVVVTRTPDVAKPATVEPAAAPVIDDNRFASDATPPAVPSAAAPMANGKKYTIAPGDTFSSIAGKAYGNRNLYQSIINANPGIDPSRLKVGTEIVLPPTDAVKNERGSMAAPARAQTGAIDTTREYRVQGGDTLHGISKKLYGRTSYWMAIYDLNKPAIGSDAGRLKLGTVLQLPQRPDAR